MLKYSTKILMILLALAFISCNGHASQYINDTNYDIYIEIGYNAANISTADYNIYAMFTSDISGSYINTTDYNIYVPHIFTNASLGIPLIPIPPVYYPGGGSGNIYTTDWFRVSPISLTYDTGTGFTQLVTVKSLTVYYDLVIKVNYTNLPQFLTIEGLANNSFYLRANEEKNLTFRVIEIPNMTYTGYVKLDGYYLNNSVQNKTVFVTIDMPRLNLTPVETAFDTIQPTITCTVDFGNSLFQTFSLLYGYMMLDGIEIG